MNKTAVDASFTPQIVRKRQRRLTGVDGRLRFHADFVHGNGVVVGHNTVQPLMRRAGACRENAQRLTSWKLTRGETAHLMARTRAEKLGLRGNSR
jgi:hypothetical protein